MRGDTRGGEVSGTVSGSVDSNYCPLIFPQRLHLLKVFVLFGWVEMYSASSL